MTTAANLAIFGQTVQYSQSSNENKHTKQITELKKLNS